MKITVLSLFPDILAAYFNSSIMARAVERGLIEYQLVDVRDFAKDRHRTCDDAPYGGGCGMVLMAEPLASALDSVVSQSSRVIYLTPSGSPFSQPGAQRLSECEDLIFICGRYEGIDQRIIDLYVHEQISVGDYVLSSGEVASLVVVDALYRLRQGVINPGSLSEESHNDGLLEYPHYTRPEIFREMQVPEILLSGHHEHIRQWRRRQSIERTAAVRPDLLETAELSDEERRGLHSGDGGDNGSH